SVLLASWAHARLAPKMPRPQLGAALGFVGFFLVESLRSGLDVARRILPLHPRIAPGIQEYRMQLENPLARALFLNSISLLPGSLSADLSGRERVRVHALDARTDLGPELARLERRIARLFGETLTTEPLRHD
ncbi:MAG: Na+/H+ antiporter subunit E, partial [Chromatiaceae bacterium]|nr:Na+/H+ antiporter subunit E [Chromatiaceae bacterium]